MRIESSYSQSRHLLLSVVNRPKDYTTILGLSTVSSKNFAELWVVAAPAVSTTMKCHHRRSDAQL